MDANETFAVDHSALKTAQIEDDEQDDCWVEQRKNLGNVFAAVSKSSAPMKKAAMQVFVRVRPTTNPHSEDICIVQPEETIEDESGNVKQYPTQIQTATKHFEFSGIFTPSSSQEDVYRSTLDGYIDGLRAGKSALVFCYGRTNTGKTHTVTGTLEDPVQWGLIPRALKDLLPSTISYFEIYNEQVYDLLGKVSSFNQPTSAKLGPLLRNVSSHLIDNMDSAMSYLHAAHQTRRSASNNVNARSSRSHALCRLELPNGAVLWIVDLAGSEKATPGMRLKESIYINRSLSTLNRCFLALKNQKPLPYRDSKLTHILGQHWKSCDGCRTTLIVNLTLDDASSASQVLEYASIAAKAQTVPSRLTNTSRVAYDLNGRRRIVQSIKQVVQMLSPRRNVKETKSTLDYSVTKGTATSMGSNVSTVRKELDSDHSDDDHSSPGDKKRIADMLEVVQDCEEEMNRLRETHHVEFDQLKMEYETKLETVKNEAAAEIARLGQELAHRGDELKAQQEDIEALEELLDRVNEEKASTRDELGRKEAQLLDMERQLESLSHELAESRSQVMEFQAISAEEQHDLKDTPNMSPGKENAGRAQSNTVRESNVSCGDVVTKISLDEDDQIENAGRAQSNVVRESNESSFGDAVKKNTVDEGDQIELLATFKPPARKVRCDPLTGKYLRPRGRAPSGALNWDEDRGAWRMSMA